MQPTEMIWVLYICNTIISSSTLVLISPPLSLLPTSDTDYVISVEDEVLHAWIHHYFAQAFITFSPVNSQANV